MQKQLQFIFSYESEMVDTILIFVHTEKRNVEITQILVILTFDHG